MARRTGINLPWTVVAVIVFAGLLTGTLAGFILSARIPDPPEPKAATIIYDINGNEITRLFLEHRIPVSLDQIPQLMKDAIISVEDHEFYHHRGINIRAMFRALWRNIRAGKVTEGASTITQQLARNALLTHQRTLKRKIKEILIAINLERRLTKDEILERYLNEIYFGHGAHGVEAAAQLYFGKHIWELELHQFALLAAIPRGPNLYSPYNEPERAVGRRAWVINRMVVTGIITEELAEQAKKKPLDVVPQTSVRRQAPYFVDYIIQELTQKHGFAEETLYTEGYKIYTTLDLELQVKAEEALAKRLPAGKADENGILQPQAALVAMDPTNGQIRAMIGGRDFLNTQLNRAVRAHRQPGSAMKPFVYTAAIDSGLFTPATVLVDEPIEYVMEPVEGGEHKEPWIWKPRNYSDTFRGPMRLREALEDSINIIAIKVVEELGPAKVVNYARKMGLTSLVTSGAINDLNFSSLALGGLVKGVTPLEMASAFTPLANRGVYSEPIAILKVTSAEGLTVLENTSRRKVVLSESTAYLMTDLLKGVIENGTGWRARLGRPAAGKTGTSNDNTNAWFVGYTPELLATVWIGNDKQTQPLIDESGARLSSAHAAQIWGEFMRQALADKPITDFTPPAEVTFGVEICAESGFLASPYCREIIPETFKTGTEPQEACPLHTTPDLPSITSLQICLDSGQLATEHCPPERVVYKNYWVSTGMEIWDGTPMPQEKCVIHGKEELVVVKICTESGLLATPFCPPENVITQSFVKGEEPSFSCNLHLPFRMHRR